MQLMTERNLRASYFGNLNTNKKPVSMAVLTSGNNPLSTRIIYSKSRRSHGILQQLKHLLGGIKRD